MSKTECGHLFCRSGNIGDDIQAIAAAQHLPSAPLHYVDRDTIHQQQTDQAVTLIMNGWFSGNRQAWPPATNIEPVFVGFHITEKMKPSIIRHVSYLKKFGTIGTRDPATTDFLRTIGVEAETTYCLSLTLPERTAAPSNGKVYIVDANTISIPSSLRRGAVKLSHMMPPLDYRATLPAARQLLDLYRDTARLVITTRLHAAMPCIAMGIPVIYFADPRDGRANIVRDIGGVIYDKRLHLKALGRGVIGKLISSVDWSPRPIDISHVKANLAAAVSNRLAVKRSD